MFYVAASDNGEQKLRLNTNDQNTFFTEGFPNSSLIGVFGYRPTYFAMVQYISVTQIQ
jgi:hypothetical protein